MAANALPKDVPIGLPRSGNRPVKEGVISLPRLINGHPQGMGSHHLFTSNGLCNDGQQASQGVAIQPTMVCVTLTVSWQTAFQGNGDGPALVEELS